METISTIGGYLIAALVFCFVAVAAWLTLRSIARKLAAFTLGMMESRGPFSRNYRNRWGNDLTGRQAAYDCGRALARGLTLRRG